MILQLLQWKFVQVAFLNQESLPNITIKLSFDKETKPHIFAIN